MSNIFKNDSKYQEQVIEYKFLSDLMIKLSCLEIKLELLRVHTDSFGYDIILKINDKIKYIQLKSRKKGGNTNYWDIHKSLIENENGYLIVIYYSFKEDDLLLDYYYLDESKYRETVITPPKSQKKDEMKYCKASKKNLIKMNDLQELIGILYPGIII